MAPRHQEPAVRREAQRARTLFVDHARLSIRALSCQVRTAPVCQSQISTCSCCAASVLV
jgi:hypothetical protein